MLPNRVGVVVYWEGCTGYVFDAGWAVDPPLFIPSAEMWNEVVPDWLQDRRDVIVDRLASLTGFSLREDVHGYGNEASRRVIHAD